MVLPTLEKRMMKKLETRLFQFMWNGKPDKVSRDHAKLAEKDGGLGMVDIKLFWDSLKFSWSRRLCNSKAFWVDIFEVNIKNIVGMYVNVTDFLQFGPLKIVNIAKKNAQ